MASLATERGFDKPLDKAVGKETQVLSLWRQFLSSVKERKLFQGKYFLTQINGPQ